MKNSDSPVPRRDEKETAEEVQLSKGSEQNREPIETRADENATATADQAADASVEQPQQQPSGSAEQSDKKTDKAQQHPDKKKKKRNLWPLKALVISLTLAFAVNALSSFSLSGANLWISLAVTVLILILGVVFDMIGTAATSCDVGPFLAMASRKVKGGKMAVKLAKKRDIVSSVCCDIVGDICGIVSGVCAATIAAEIAEKAGLATAAAFWVSVSVYAIVSMATITLKAAGKGIAVKKANSIVYGVAKILSIFGKKG